MKAEVPYIGVDVAKDQLDVAARPGGETWAISNYAAGITELVQRLATLRPELVALEAMRGIQMPVADALAAAGLPLAMGQSPPGPRLCQSHQQAGKD